MATATTRNGPTLRRSRRIWQRNENPAGGILLRLPPELREMIYTLLFSDGHLDILRVSRIINTEAQLVLYQAGVLRQMAGLHNHDSYRVSGIKSSIQNFELQYTLYSRLAHRSSGKNCSSAVGEMQMHWRTSYWNCRPASDFVDSHICRNQMVIKLDFGPRSSSAFLIEVESWIEMLLERARGLIGFKFLVVEATRTPRSWTMADRTRIGALVNSILEPELGPARGDDIGRIEYRPWSVVACQQHTIQLVPSRHDFQHGRLPPYKWFQLESERKAEEEEEEEEEE